MLSNLIFKKKLFMKKHNYFESLLAYGLEDIA